MLFPANQIAPFQINMFYVSSQQKTPAPIIINALPANHGRRKLVDM